MNKILDVSEHQPNIDYAAAAKEVDGVILRCGVTHWGTANECVADECFERHYAGFAAQKVPMGAYYYSAADCEKRSGAASSCWRAKPLPCPSTSILRTPSAWSR